MDVNQPTPITAVNQDAKKSPQHRDPEEQGSDNGEQDSGKSGSWRENAAVDVNPGLVKEVTPEVQAIIDSLNQRIEPLRAELELTKGRETHFRELAARHSFLDVPCRREFIRELTHIINHIDRLTVPPAVIVMHLVGTEAVRMEAGRAALDYVLGEACTVLTGLLQSVDILGNLGGNDFGIILFSADEKSVTDTVNKLSAEIGTYQFVWSGQAFQLDMIAGTDFLTAETSAEAVLDAADQNLRARLADQAMISGKS